MSREETREKNDSFDAAYQALVRSDASKDLARLRERAFASFRERGLPNRRDEDWKYTSLASLQKQVFAVGGNSSPDDLDFLEPLLHPDAINVVFIDGFLATGETGLDKLPEGLSIETIREAISKKRLSTDDWHVGAESALEDLNLALLTDGVVIDVAADVVIKTPIHLIHVATGCSESPQQKLLTSVRNVVRIGRHAQVELLESTFGLGDDTYLMNDRTEISLASGARLQHLLFQELSKPGLKVGQGRVAVDRDAAYRSFVFTVGQGLVRNNLDIVLSGRGASARFDGAYLVAEGMHVDNHTTVDHAVPDTSSQQTYKGILQAGRGVFNGKVLVRPDANGTNAAQLNKNVLLSKDAEIDTKPELRIDANDVKCSHGAAVGQLSEDEIFYCETRGIPKKQAVTMLCRAFVEELLLDVESLNYLEIVEPSLDRYLDHVSK